MALRKAVRCISVAWRVPNLARKKSYRTMSREALGPGLLPMRMASFGMERRAV